ncbi:MAG: diguanylate cyclase [Gracilibacteraceae bacterium]|nr:diguanylate cyclase [Gracilibacteraceae bacterium]
MTNLIAAIIYFMLVVVTVFTILFAYIRNRQKLVTKHLIRLCLISLGWQISSALFFLVEDETLALWLFDAKLVFVAFAPLQLLLLSVKFFSAKSSRKGRLLFILLCIIPAITAVLAITAPWHNLLRAELFWEQTTPLRTLHNVRGLWFWVHSAYSYILMASSIFVILYQRSKLPKGYRVSSLLAALGSTIALLSNLVVVFTPYFQNIDLTVVGLCVALVFTCAGVAISDESSLLVQALDNIFAYLEDYIFILNGNRTIIEINPAAQRWLRSLGLSSEPACFDDLIQQLVSENKGALYVDKAGEQDFRLMINQRVSNYNIKERPIIDQSGRQIGAFTIFTDITRYTLLIRHIEQTAGIDPLTNLGNRRSYDEALQDLDEPSSLPFSVILGDVNGLKFVNDNMGHAVGDGLLRNVAQALNDACPEGTRAFRIGGDEFVLLLPRTPAPAAAGIADAIHTALARHNSGSPYRASIALGIATKETEEQDLRECIARADGSMYLNKQNDRRSRRE